MLLFVVMDWNTALSLTFILTSSGLRVFAVVQAGEAKTVANEEHMLVLRCVLFPS